MPNAWVEFVRQYAKDNNLSYGCAISEASPAYRKMKQGTQTPKTPTKKRITIKKPIERMEEPEEKRFDQVSSKLQQKLMITSLDKLKNALINLNFRGRLQKQVMLRNLQILQNFNTIPKMKALIKELN